MTRRFASLGLGILVSGLVAAVLAVAIVPAATGTRPVTIIRTSMQDSLPIGSLVYIRAEPEYHVGDFATFRMGSNIVTHELIEILPNPRNAAFDGTRWRTQGTANPTPDPWVVEKDAILGRAIFHVPGLGVLATILGSLNVQIFVILLGIGLYIASSRPPRPHTRILRKVQADRFDPERWLASQPPPRDVPVIRSIPVHRPARSHGSRCH